MTSNTLMPCKKREKIQLKHGNVQITGGCLGSLVDRDLNIGFNRPEQTEDLILVNLVHHGPLFSIQTPQHQLSL